MVAVHHALLVVLGDTVGGAQGDNDGVVGGRQIDVGDTGTGVGGVDDGLAVGAVVHPDAGLDGLLVGGIQCQRHVVEVLLQQLHRPGHQLRAVGLGGADVHVQIGGAGLDLLGGTLQDRLGIHVVHGLADHGADAVDALADGDELGRVGIALLVADAHIHHLDLGDGHGDLLEVQRSVGVHNGLLLVGRLLGGGHGLGGLDVLAVAQVLHQLHGLAGAHHHVPVGQLILNVALHHSGLAGDDQGAVVDLAGNIVLIEELLDGAGGELTGGPRGQHGHTGRVGDQQVHRHLGALQLAGDQEVGQGEVHGQGAGIVGGRAVDGIDARLHLHGLLRIGEHILAQTVQRQRLGIAHGLHGHDGAVLHGEHSRQSGLHMYIAAAQLGQIHDRGIAEGAVAVLQGGTTHQHGIGEGLLHGGAGHVDDQILVVQLLQRGHGVVELRQIGPLDAQHHAGFHGDGVHGFVVILVGTVQQGLGVADGGQSQLGVVHALGVDNDGPLGSGSLLAQLCQPGAVAGVMDQQELHILTLADALVIHGLHFGDLGVHSGVVHAGAQGHGKAVAIDKGLFMTHHHGLAAQLHAADIDGLHGRRGCLAQQGDGLVGHIGALLNGQRALGHLHAERHTGGHAALLAVLLRGQFENI